MTATLNIAVVILAAGESSRFGSDKRRAVLPSGETVLEHCIATVIATGLPYRLVVRPQDLFSELDNVLVAPNAAQGMGATIADAVKNLEDQFDCLLLLPVDLPVLQSKTILAVAEKADIPRIVRPRYSGIAGHPVAFGSAFFPELAVLRGDEGARSVLKNHSAAVEFLDIEDPGICLDMDTPGALQALISQGYFSVSE